MNGSYRENSRDRKASEGRKSRVDTKTMNNKTIE